MTHKSEGLGITAADLKSFLNTFVHSDDVDLTISDIARAVGIEPSTMNRYINSNQSHLPAYMIPHLPVDLRASILHHLDNESGNPLKGRIDTSDLNGQIRDECDGIVESLGEIIRLERLLPGVRSKEKKIKFFQNIRDYALRAEQEISNRG